MVRFGLARSGWARQGYLINKQTGVAGYGVVRLDEAR